MIYKTVQKLMFVLGLVAMPLLHANRVIKLFTTPKKAVTSAIARNSFKYPVDMLYATEHSKPFPGSKKWAVRKKLEELQNQAQSGQDVTFKDLHSFDSFVSQASPYENPINVPHAKTGHSLLYYLMHSGNKQLVSAMKRRGALLNNRDRFELGTTNALRAELNMASTTSDKKIERLFKSFMTKNSQDKLQARRDAEELTWMELNNRIAKKQIIVDLYSKWKSFTA